MTDKKGITVSSPQVINPLAKDEPKPVSRIAQSADALASAYAGAGTLKLTKEESAALLAPFDDNDVEILPTGEIYVPHMLVRDRLNAVLGVGQWTLVPREIKLINGTMCVDCVLIVRGKYVGEAIGEAEYYENNPRMTYASALEAAKANALTRIAGKFLGVASQCWRPSYVRGWVSKFAVSYTVKDRTGKVVTRWRRKDAVQHVQNVATPPQNVAPVPAQGEQENNKPDKPATQRQLGVLRKFLRDNDVMDSKEQEKAIAEIFEKKSFTEVTSREISDAIDKIMRGAVTLAYRKDGTATLKDKEEPPQTEQKPEQKGAEPPADEEPPAEVIDDVPF